MASKVLLAGVASFNCDRLEAQPRYEGIASRFGKGFHQFIHRKSELASVEAVVEEFPAKALALLQHQRFMRSVVSQMEQMQHIHEKPLAFLTTNGHSLN
ncbi:MAG: hypothetical protein SFZ03_07985 [Candidatus Melainabacteria bacterium]|nr:hypothetical protein [Candidatus Melainabacteria bacterium]